MSESQLAPPVVIVDASALVAVLMREPAAEFVARVLVDHTIVAPASIDFEVGNALVNSFRRKRISADGLLQAIATYEELSITRLDVALRRAMQIAAKYGIYAYDSYMLQCAEDRGLALLTLDQGLERTARAHGVSVVEVFR